MIENKNITVKSQDIQEMGYGIANNFVSIDLEVIGHFNNTVSLILTATNVIPYSGYANTKNIGLILQYLVELLGISREDGIYLSEMKDIPVRLVFDSSECSWGSKCMGIGNFMEDKFVLFKDLSVLGKEEDYTL